MSRYKEVQQELQHSPKVWLITGVAGFIGSNLAERLEKDGHNVISIDNYSFGKKENEHKNVKYINDDLENIHSINEPIDICYHLAAKARVQPSFHDPVDYFRVNAKGTMEVIKSLPRGVQELGVVGFLMLGGKGKLLILFLGAIFDSVDGRVARMTGTQSSFGEQFDSLSDLISFGIAPSIIFYNKFLMLSTQQNVPAAEQLMNLAAKPIQHTNALDDGLPTATS